MLVFRASATLATSTQKQKNTHTAQYTTSLSYLLPSHSPVRVLRGNFVALDLFSGAADLQRYPGLDLQPQGYESGNQGHHGAYRQAEGPQSRRHRSLKLDLSGVSLQRVVEGGWGWVAFGLGLAVWLSVLRLQSEATFKLSPPNPSPR